MSESQRVLAIVQARMGSSRLPGKVLAEIEGRPMLGHVVARAARIEGVDEVLVATTEEAPDDAIVEFCESEGWPVFRGHATDVLDRYYRAAQEHKAEVIVRATGDCPLLDPGVSGRTLQAFLQAGPALDFAANRLPDRRSYPIGLDTEVCSMQALGRAWREAEQPHQREHVMPFLYEDQERFRVRVLQAEQDWGRLRWTVDTEQDLEFVRAVFKAFAPRTTFNWRELLALLERRPELAAINQDVEHRGARDVDRRFRSAGKE